MPPEKADDFNKKRGATSTALLIDSDGTLGRGYGAIVTPHMFIVDSQGVVVYAGAPTDKSTTDTPRVFKLLVGPRCGSNGATEAGLR